MVPSLAQIATVLLATQVPRCVCATTTLTLACSVSTAPFHSALLSWWPQVDVFVIKSSDIGDIERVVISHDDSGVGSAWHCQMVCGT